MGNDALFQKEWQMGWAFLAANELEQAEFSFERAHHLGVFSTKNHFLAHYAKLHIALVQKKVSHVILQLFLMLIAPISLFTYWCYRIKLFLPMHPEVKQVFDEEMRLAELAYQARAFDKAVQHLGRAHILGSHFCFAHFRTHWRLLKIECKKHHVRGMVIQCIRTFAALGTRFFIHAVGVTGNPGSTQHPIGTRLPITADLQVLLVRQGLL